MSLSNTQSKLLSRIKALTEVAKAEAESRNEPFSGRISSGELGSVEFGWHKVRMATAMALIKAELIELIVVVDRYDDCGKVRLERSYRFRLLNEGEKPSVKYWFESAVDAWSSKYKLVGKAGQYSVYETSI